MASQTNSIARKTSTGEILIPFPRYFPEGVAVTHDGTFYIGSLDEGRILKAAAGTLELLPFVESGTNGLVSVLGLWVDEERNLLWVCSSDAGNAQLSGSAPPGIKVFDLTTGEPKGSYDFPGGGFPNHLTFDSQGNLYATDSLTPRILRLAAGSSALEEWLCDPQLGPEKWSLNGIDFDKQTGVLYVVNQLVGKLFRVAIRPDGRPGKVTLIHTTRPLRRPDELQVIAPSTLATVEQGAGGVAVLTVVGDNAEVNVVSEGLDFATTFAYYGGSAWVAETQSHHFWYPEKFGRDANPPFRIVEIPLPAMAGS